MFRLRTIATAIALACASTVHADEGDIAQIRAEIQQMKQSYERRIEQLEQRLSAAEAKAGTAQAAAAQAQTKAAQAQTTAAQAAHRPAQENAFNPAMSVILQGTAARTSQDPKNFQISGFAPSGGDVSPARRGFSLGESELFLTGNIDPYFRGQLVASLTPDDTLSIEEASFQTLGLGSGFTLKGGRFLSGIGYLNSVHQHAWDFQDAPLPYKAFLGGTLIDDGVQAKWIAPTDELLVELGGELGRGRSFPAADTEKNGAGAWSLFGHLGGDVGDSTAWRAGLSYYRASPRNRAFVDPAVTAATQAFSGQSKLWIADGVLKWAPNGNSTVTNFKLQGEYFRRTEDGELAYTGVTTPLPAPYDSRQSGWYLQGVYQFMPRWRVGYRYDRLSHGAVYNGLVGAATGLTAASFPLLMSDYNPSRNTAMIDWSLTEFSRIRLQIAADRSRMGVTDNQVLLQYIYSLGAHGAHSF